MQKGYGLDESLYTQTQTGSANKVRAGTAQPLLGCYYVLANDALRAWKVLSNPRSPLVKIRQTMRMMFGDYRAKMAQEEKEFGLRECALSIISTVATAS